jgi:Putative Zn-dependent protease, contains TPR repeats
MAIKGSLKEASLPDVLQLLAMGKKTGCLDIEYRSSSGSIYFDAGRICHALIYNRDLDTENAVYSLFTWTSGTFNFEPGIAPVVGTPLASIDPQSLLLEGARRVDEWSLIEKKIPSFDSVFAIDRQRLLLNKLPLTSEQSLLIPLLDGNRDVHALIRDSGLGEFETGKALYGLVSASFALPVVRATKPSSAPRDASHDERRGLAIALYRAGMYEDAERELTAITSADIPDPVALFYLGVIYLRKRRWKDASEVLQQAAPSLPVKTAVLHNLAFAFERMGQLEKAQLLAERAVAASKKSDPLVQLQAGIIALESGQIRAARLALAEARALWTSGAPPAIWFHYAALVSAQGDDPQRELLLLGAGTEMHSDSPILFNNLAAALNRRGSFQQAREAAARGLSISPDLPQLQRNLADAVQGLGRENTTPEHGRAD